MYHPNVLPTVYMVDGHRGEVHPAVDILIEHGRTLAYAVIPERRLDVLSITAMTLGRLVKQTSSEAATAMIALTAAFKRADRPTLVEAFRRGEASTVSSPVDVPGFMAWDGSPRPKAPLVQTPPSKPVDVSPEPITAPVAPEDRRARKASSEALAARVEANRTRAMASDATEDQIQIGVADMLRSSASPATYWFHVPNGGYRSEAIGAKFKAMGVRSGVPDLIVIIGGKVHGLELKRAKGGTVSAEQKTAHAEMQAAGVTVAVAKGYDQAIDQLRQWGIIRS